MSAPLVPVVDLAPWWDGGAAERAAVADALDVACRGSGFLQVVGHRVPRGTVDAAFDALDRFFDRPDDAKGRARPADRALYRGHMRRKSESLAYSAGVATPADLVESYVVGAEDVDPGPAAGAGGDLFAVNVWPDDVPGFREAVWTLFTSLRALSVDLLDVAALALDVEPDFFRTRTDHSVVTMRCNWYQRRTEDDLQPGQLQLGAHTDYGICTVLAADPGPGLQVVGPEGGWHDVEPAPGAFIVNLGDAMAVWTDDAWHSTIHRVVPTAIADGSRRRSFALFQDGNLETTLETLPAFRHADRPSKYPRTTLGDHLQEKIHSGRTGTLATTAVQTTGARLGDS